MLIEIFKKRLVHLHSLFFMARTSFTIVGLFTGILGSKQVYMRIKKLRNYNGQS
jgi:hypothetical protein